MKTTISEIYKQKEASRGLIHYLISELKRFENSQTLSKAVYFTDLLNHKKNKKTRPL